MHEAKVAMAFGRTVQDIVGQATSSDAHLMQAVPLRHLQGFRRLFCLSANMCCVPSGYWQRRAPSSPIFRSPRGQELEVGNEHKTHPLQEYAGVSTQNNFVDGQLPSQDFKGSTYSRVLQSKPEAAQVDLTNITEAHTSTLLEELFPQETKSSHRRPSNPTQYRHIPRRPFGLGPWDLSNSIGSKEHVTDSSNTSYTGSYVLVLKSAGKCLAEEDFRRVVPGAGELEGWNSEADLIRGTIRLCITRQWLWH